MNTHTEQPGIEPDLEASGLTASPGARPTAPSDIDNTPGDTRTRPRPIPKRVRKLLAQALYTGPTVRANQLVGLESCVRQLTHQIALIDRPDLAARMGLEPSGTLFIGAAGTGKTHAARYLAGLLQIPFYHLSADQFDGDPSLVHGVLLALRRERAILFIDEISILAQRREYSHDREMLVALLAGLDGLASEDDSRQLWVVGACTADIALDPAIYRSGRLGVIVEFTLPSEEQRCQLFRLYLTKVPHCLDEADISRLARMSAGATGADIHDWVSQAAAEALADAVERSTSQRDAGTRLEPGVEPGVEPVVDPVVDPVVELRHIELVVERRGFIAAERPGRAPTRRQAIHEAGHAVLAYAVFGPDSLGEVQLGFGVGGALDELRGGHFSFAESWAVANPPNSTSWIDHAVVGLAGVAAEDHIFGNHDGGSASDATEATDVIKGQLGTADTDFGPAWDGVARLGGDSMKAHAWALVRSRYGRCEARAASLVREHRAEIERVADRLLAADSALTGEEIVAVIESHEHQAA